MFEINKHGHSTCLDYIMSLILEILQVVKQENLSTSCQDGQSKLHSMVV